MIVLVTADGLRVGSPVPWAIGLPVRLRDWFRPAMAARPSPRPQAGSAVAEDGDDARLDEWRDVQASLSGDGEAFERLVRRHQQSIGETMWRFTRHRGQWEELVQEVFVEAFFSLATYKAKAPLLHWLRRIAVRVGYRWWNERDRQKSLAPVTVQEWDRPVEEDRGGEDAEDAAAVVHALLARMSVRDRLVLTLMYLEECSVAEIARLTGWSKTMVKVQAYRARKRLKTLLEESEAQR